MRPIYETKEDLEKEASLGSIISRRWKCRMQKLQPRDPFDYAAVRDGKISAFIEIKNRTNRMLQYPTYMISMTKVVNATMTTISTGLPCFLVVRWIDKIGYINIGNVETFVTMGGRIDRSDPQDVEPVCHIDIRTFKRFEKFN